MAFSIDIASYPKATRYPQRHGYQLRGTMPTSIVIHTTSNRNKNTAFAGEARFLFESADVSAHFLVSKTGQIIRFLEPRTYQAWHAGVALEAFSNARSIGIELHVSVGEQPTEAQKDATAWLCRELMREFGIAPEKIETHRKIARPVGRKSDPEGWIDQDFYAWRAALQTPPRRRFRARGIPIYQATSLTGTLAGHLQNGEVFEIDATYQNGGVHLADGRGFVDLDLDALEEV